MLYAAIDIHKHAFQAAVLDAESGEVVEERFAADRESLTRWTERWRGRVVAVAIEAAQAAGAALGGGAEVARARAPAGRLTAGGDGGAGRATGQGRRRVASFRPRRPALPGVAVDLRDRADPRLPPACRDRRGVPLPARRADHPPGRPRPGRRRVGRQPPPRQAREGRLAAPALGAGRSRRARAPHNRPRPRPLPGHPRATRHHGGATDGRPQNRQTRLPRPARARARRGLTDGLALTRSRFRLSPAIAALHFGMSRLSRPRLDNLRRKPRAPR